MSNDVTSTPTNFIRHIIDEDLIPIVIGYYHVYDDVTFRLGVVQQEDVVGKVKLIVGIVKDVAFIGGQFFELVDEIVA